MTSLARTSAAIRSAGAAMASPNSGKHVGDGALRDGEAEQALADLGQPLVADHLAAVQIGDRRHDPRTERRAFGHVRGRVRRHPCLAAWTRAAEQLDARRDRLDRRNVDMVVLSREVLPGLPEHDTARTELGIEAARRVGVLGELARDAGAALARRLGRRRLGVRLLPARRRQRGVGGRFGRSAKLAFELGYAGVQHRDLRQQLVDPRQQRRHEMGVIGARRIDLSLRHDERESARRGGLNTSDPSHNAAEG